MSDPNDPISALELARRAHYARRLKAGKWLAGDLTYAGGKDGRGKTKGPSIAVSEIRQIDLAERLEQVGFTPSKIGSIERMERTTQPYELEPVRKALGLPDGWFDFRGVDDLRPYEVALAEVAARRFAGAAHSEAEPQREHPAQGDEDRPGADEGGGAR
ncbi:MAG: hypothetical protein Q8O56_07470 [Solirubrobacteraceae bacterium]|nr:hypothetical protein [Solirubrobacteraceae bacterium]